MATSASDDLKTRVANELDATLKLIDDTQRRSVRAIIPGPVWLRAARGCWLLAEMDSLTRLNRAVEEAAAQVAIAQTQLQVATATQRSELHTQQARLQRLQGA
ncbi:MAG: hypothetical protein EB145_14455, partial [Proteobacteria bacterium]|nr:hypothetical protein [Pseudomonadota bacterium]